MNSARVTSIEGKRLDPKPLEQSSRKAFEPAAWGRAAPPSTTSEWLCGLLQTADSFYPTGSYAHSFGLEGLVQEGVIHDRETLRAFLFHAAVPALRHVDLPLATHAWRAFGRQDWKAIGELCVMSSALKTARESRSASENIGRQRAELVASLHDSSLAREFLRRAAENTWPVAAPIAAALEGRTMGAPIEGVLSGVYYTSVAALLSAAMKILRLGQNRCQSLLTEALALAPQLIAEVQITPIEEIGWFNPWLDIATARHETADARMFIS